MPLALAAVVFAAVAVGLVGAAATGALPGTADDAQPDAGAVLNQTEQRYANAESLVVEATVTAETPNHTESANVSLAAADPDSARVVVTTDDRRYAAGTNGSVAWVQTPGGAVVALPVPDGNLSELAADALANESSPLFANVDQGSDLPAGSIAGDLPANWTTETLPENWSTTDVVAAWTSGDLPAAWSGGDLPANWSVTEGHDRSDRANLTDRSPNATVEMTGTETIDGTETYVLELRAANENESLPGNATLWVATGDYSVRRAQVSHGESRLTVDVTTTRFNASIQDSTFRPPEGSALTDTPRATYDSFAAAQANTSFDLGRLEGESYTFANATVATRAGQTVAVQQYVGDDGERVGLVATDGVLPFGVGEGTPVTVDGADATFVEVGDRAAVVWETGGVTRAVVADLPQSELVALAGRVRP